MARNTGIKHSRGEYLVFLDADDVILPEKIMCQVGFMKEYPRLCRLRPDSMCLDWDRIFKSWKKVINKILTTSSSLTPEERFALRHTDIYKNWEIIYYQLRSSAGSNIPVDLHETITATRNLFELIPYNIRTKNNIHDWNESLSSNTNEFIESVMLIMDLYDKVDKCSAAIRERDEIIKHKDSIILKMMDDRGRKITAPLRKFEEIIQRIFK